MPRTQADLEAIQEAIDTGTVEVRFADGRQVRYRDLADLRSIRDEIAAEIGAAPEPIRTTFASFSRD